MTIEASTARTTNHRARLPRQGICSSPILHAARLHRPTASTEQRGGAGSRRDGTLTRGWAFESEPPTANIDRRVLPMGLLEQIKRITEKATGWKQPDDPQKLVRERKPQTYRFADDGLIPNHPKWQLVIYKNVVRLPRSFDPAAVFEVLFESNGWGDSWRDGIYDYVHYHSRIHEVLGIARGSGRVQFGGPKGRTLT